MSKAPEVFIEAVEAIDASLIITQMFGKPCAKADGGKPFLSYFQDCMVYKLGAERCLQIMKDHPETCPFDPSGKGRPFKDWVQVPESAGLDWTVLGREAQASFG